MGSSGGRGSTLRQDSRGEGAAEEEETEESSGWLGSEALIKSKFQQSLPPAPGNTKNRNHL